MVEARLNLLRWDEVVSVSAFVVWAVVRSLPRADDSVAAVLKVAAGVLVRALIIGPAGAAAYTLQQRERLQS